jgi:hypothetical protein
MAKIFRPINTLVFLFLLLAGYAGNANAAAPCPDPGILTTPACTKEIRIWNSYDKPIYVLLTGVIEDQDANNCPKSTKGGGDVWLQAALGDNSNCYRVQNNYYVFVNPTKGIAQGHFASINVPWWSKPDSGSDKYIDWWRAARVIIYDDRNALLDSYANAQKLTPVTMLAGSPVVSCKAVAGNVCSKTELQTYRIPPGSAATIQGHSPSQLNEFTFASVKAVKDGGTFINFNQNYNVSNVDQTYLPVAIEPVRLPTLPADIGYLGTTTDVTTFRTTLTNFTGPNGGRWPIYNNPLKTDGNRLYPDAGIRVPSPLILFNFYMNPGKFNVHEPDGTTQSVYEIVPEKPPLLVQDMMDQWTLCTGSKATSANCPEYKVYREVNNTFLTSYEIYYEKCAAFIPKFLQPVVNNPDLLSPSLYAFLRYVHGWVPFNQGCKVAVPELPTPKSGSRVPLDYINLQYNYLTKPPGTGATGQQVFNPYTKFIHQNLRSTAYAFSIDDRTAFLSNAGGGLIIAVGGPNGLVNGQPTIPPLPEVNVNFDIVVSLQPAPGTLSWAKYGICSPNADQNFPPPAVNPVNGRVSGYAVAASTITYNNISAANPCLMTFTDSKGRKYQISLNKTIPWRKWDGMGFDTQVMSCPAIPTAATWCQHTNELAIPPTLGEPTWALLTAGLPP